ncbi:ankyrin repeat-containing domain protein [Trichoderma evansii]
MSAILQSNMEEVNKNTAKLKLGNSEVIIKDAAEVVLAVVGSANNYVTQAAGVSFLLPLFTNMSTQSASLAKGLEYISHLISQGQMREEFYITFYESRTSAERELQQSHRVYKTALERLYRQILKFQAKSCCYYSNISAFRHGLDAIKWNDWDLLINEVRQRDEHFIEVERTWQYIERRLAAENMQQSTMDSLSAIKTDITASRKAAEKAMTRKERTDLLDWLCSSDPSSIYNTARDRHESGTNEWLVKDKEFKIWETSPGSLLWLHGKVGSGKSVLSSSVVHYLKHQYDPSPSTALAYFYFSFSDIEKQKVDAMLASLIKQICSRRSDTPQLIEKFRDYKTKGERPDNEALEAALVATTPGFSAVCIIIDGLDECPLFNNEREKLLKSLQHILLNDDLKNLHIFLTSRKEPDIDLKIRGLLSSPSRLENDLLAHQETINEDIRLYIGLTLATDDFKSWPADIKEEAKQPLTEKADCMFQYVRFQFQMLQNLSSVAEIREALQNLPIGLDATYDRIFKSIDIKFQIQVINSLKWLAFSKRLLSPEELSEIFIIYQDKHVVFDENARLFSSSDLLKYFSSLIIIQKSSSGGIDEKEKYTVRLVHLSFQKYLTSHRIGESSVSAFSFTRVDAHIHITRSCLAYLTHLNTAAEGTNKTNTFWSKWEYHLIEYAAMYWTTHLEEIPHASWIAKVAPNVVLALAHRSQSLLALLVEKSDTEKFHQHMLNKPHCYTAYHGFRQLTKLLISQKLGANKYITQEDLDFGLHYAAYGGHLDIVQLLFEKGANIDTRCGNWNSVVHAAMSGAHLNVLEFFVRKGADISSQPSLLACISRCDTKCLEFLLDRMNIEMQDEYCGSALHKAIADDNSKHVDLVLKRKAQVNALSEKLGTPLHVACAAEKMDSNQRLHYVEKLLGCDADPNIRGGIYATALQAACHQLQYQVGIKLAIKIVQLLIENGADVNVQGGKWGSALHAAAASRQPEAVEAIKLLLDNGANVEKQSCENWGTVLQVACYHGTEEAVRFLLDQGSAVNAGSGRFGTPLLAAAARKDDLLERKLGILNLLVERGANINQQGGEYGSALQTVFYSYAMVEPLRFLIEHGADVNAKGGKHGTALIAACGSSWRDAECVQFLLYHGANVNAQSEEYGTALIAACQPHYHDGERDTKIVEMILGSGADIKAQGGEYGTALSAACSQGHSELVQLLLNHGADVHLQDCAAWYTATRYRNNVIHDDNTDVLKLLLEHGMDINHVHAEFGTALHVIMTGRIWRNGIDFLLEHHIDVNIMVEQLGSALHIACALQDEDDHDHTVFQYGCWHCENINSSSNKTKYLLERSSCINVNAKGGIFGTALQAAAFSGQALSVRLLLDRKARVNERGGKYRSALNGAIVSGYWNIVKILLEAGATPDYHLQERPDEEWLQTVLEEDGRGAVERYRKFWEVESMAKEEGDIGLN